MFSYRTEKRYYNKPVRAWRMEAGVFGYYIILECNWNRFNPLCFRFGNRHGVIRAYQNRAERGVVITPWRTASPIRTYRRDR